MLSTDRQTAGFTKPMGFNPRSSSNDREAQEGTAPEKKGISRTGVKSQPLDVGNPKNNKQ